MTAEIYYLIITGLVLSNIILFIIAFSFNQERHHYKIMSDFWEKESDSQRVFKQKRNALLEKATDKLDRIKEILEEK